MGAFGREQAQDAAARMSAGRAVNAGMAPEALAAKASPAA